MDLAGTAALVTGSATGIGRATALALARRGCHVMVNYTRSEAEARATAREVEALGAR
ncbi:MAG: SDR family NAD(P)-dependent oxidoreductase, partial [Candidatus Rokubacteria bacterium]|nr:SDR family NAD(P)-dependent oxidoreductase [Candidatus Rokubacteria bacterium]